MTSSSVTAPAGHEQQTARPFAVVFVCTGNTCRSPMAEMLLSDLAAARKLPVRAWSRGVAVAAGADESINAKAVFALRARGVDVRAHTPTMVSADDIARADALVVMTASHRARLLELRPEAAPKLHLLAAFGPAPSADIGDPFGEEQPAYDECLATMAPLLERVAIDIESGRLVRSAWAK